MGNIIIIIGVKGGKIIQSLTNNIDLLPTILNLIDAKTSSDIEGKSFLPILSGEKKEINDEIYTEITYHEIYNPIRSVRTQNYKYIRNFEPSITLYQIPKDIYGDYSGKVMKKKYKVPRPMEEFYDLERDPLEKMNLINDSNYSEVISDLQKKLDDWMRKTNDPLLVGKVKSQKNVLINYKKIELFEHIYLPFVGVIQNLLRIKCLHKPIRKLLKYIP